MKALTTLLVGTLLSSGAHAAIDVTSYDLELSIDPVAKTVGGTATVTLIADGEATVSLDFVGLEVSEVLADGAPATWSRADGKLVVELSPVPADGAELVLSVTYGGEPTPYTEDWGTWALVFESERVYAVNVTEGARHWFPCNDTPADKALFRVAVDAPEGWIVAGPGTLDESVTPPAWETARPLPTYLMVFYAGTYTLVEETHAGVPYQYYLHPTTYEDAKPTLDIASSSLEMLTARYGPYPYPKVGFAEIDLGGAVEVPSCIALGTQVFNAPEPMADVVSHEMAHAWFQGVVTVGDWSDLWLSEGMATYHEALYEEWLGGAEALRAYTKSLAVSYKQMANLAEGWFPLSAPKVYFGVTVYRKGAMVLHALRYLLGDEDFDASLNAYLATYENESATGEDFRAVVEATAGVDLGAFFDQWVDSMGYPKYDFAWRPAPDGDGVDVRIEQVQVWPTVYTLPLEVELSAGEQTFRERVAIDDRVVIARLQPGFVPEAAALDPDGWVLSDKLAVDWPPEPPPDAAPEAAPDEGPQAEPAPTPDQPGADLVEPAKVPGGGDDGCASAGRRAPLSLALLLLLVLVGPGVRCRRRAGRPRA